MCVRVCVCVCVTERDRERVAQSSPPLCNPIDCSLPGSSVHGILQARTLEWVAMPSSKDLADPGIKLRSLALRADSLPSEPPGKPTAPLQKKKKKKEKTQPTRAVGRHTPMGHSLMMVTGTFRSLSF